MTTDIFTFDLITGWDVQSAQATFTVQTTEGTSAHVKSCFTRNVNKIAAALPVQCGTSIQSKWKCIQNYLETHPSHTYAPFAAHSEDIIANSLAVISWAKRRQAEDARKRTTETTDGSVATEEFIRRNVQFLQNTNLKLLKMTRAFAAHMVHYIQQQQHLTHIVPSARDSIKAKKALVQTSEQDDWSAQIPPVSDRSSELQSAVHSFLSIHSKDAYQWRRFFSIAVETAAQSNSLIPTLFQHAVQLGFVQPDSSSLSVEKQIEVLLHTQATQLQVYTTLFVKEDVPIQTRMQSFLAVDFARLRKFDIGKDSVWRMCQQVATFGLLSDSVPSVQTEMLQYLAAAQARFETVWKSLKTFLSPVHDMNMEHVTSIFYTLPLPVLLACFTNYTLSKVYRQAYNIGLIPPTLALDGSQNSSSIASEQYIQLLQRVQTQHRDIVSTDSTTTAP